MNEQKVRGLMGLSVKAGQAVFGQDGCLKNIRGGTCSLLLVEETASENTKDMYERACRVNGTRLCYLPGGMLLAATGRPGVAIALKEGGLAEQLWKLLSSNHTNESRIQDRMTGVQNVE